MRSPPLGPPRHRRGRLRTISAVTLYLLLDDKHNSNTDRYLKVKGRLNISDTYITEFIIQSDVCSGRKIV